MFGLDASDGTDDDEVQQAQVFTDGDHAIGPDGSEWVVIDSTGRVFGEDFIRLERAENGAGSREQRGVPCRTFYDDYEVLS
jgi:hypothetical protein